MDIDGLGTTIDEQLVTRGLVHDFADLYALDVPTLAESHDLPREALRPARVARTDDLVRRAALEHRTEPVGRPGDRVALRH